MQFPLCFRASVVKLNLMSQAVAGNCSIGPSKRLLTWLPRPTPPVDFAAVAAVTTPAAEAVFMPEIPRSTPHVKALVGLDLANADSTSAASCRYTILRPGDKRCFTAFTGSSMPTANRRNQNRRSPCCAMSLILCANE